MDHKRGFTSPSGHELRGLPKVDLHCHLEATAQASTVVALAHANNVDLAGELDHLYDFSSPMGLAETFETFGSLLQTSADYELLVYEAARAAAFAGIHYREMMFSPGFHLQRGVSFATMWDGLTAGIEAGEADYGVTTRLILDVDTPRSLSLPLAMLQLIRNTDRQLLIGIGGDVKEVAAEEGALKRVVDEAKAIGLKTCLHVGEAAGASALAELIDAGVDRIAHGERLLESRELAVKVIEMELPVVSCPSSDVALGVVGSLEDHSFIEQFRRGVRVTLSSDCPAFSGLDLADEFEHVSVAFGMDRASMVAVASEAINAAWLSDGEKQEMRKALAAPSTTLASSSSAT